MEAARGCYGAQKIGGKKHLHIYRTFIYIFCSTFVPLANLFLIVKLPFSNILLLAGSYFTCYKPKVFSISYILSKGLPQNSVYTVYPSGVVRTLVYPGVPPQRHH